MTEAHVRTLCHLWGYDLVKWYDGAGSYMYSMPELIVARRASGARFTVTGFDEHWDAEDIVARLVWWSGGMLHG